MIKKYCLKLERIEGSSNKDYPTVRVSGNDYKVEESGGDFMNLTAPQRQELRRILKQTARVNQTVNRTLELTIEIKD